MFSYVTQSLRLLSLGRLTLVASVAVALLVQVGYVLVSPLFYRVIIDDGIASHDERALAIVLALFAAGMLIANVAGLVQDKVVARLAAQAGNRLREELFLAIQRRNPEAGAGDTSTGLIGGDVSIFQLSVTRGLPWAVSHTCIALASLLLLFVVEWRLALFVLACVPLILIGPRLLSRKAEVAARDAESALARATAFAQEEVSAHLPIRLFRRRRQRADQFGQLLDPVSATEAHSHLMSGLVTRSSLFATSAMIVLIVSYGAHLSLNGQLSLGSLIAFLALLLNIGDAASHLTQSVPLLYQGSAALRRIRDFTHSQAQPDDDLAARDMAPFSRAIAFENVTLVLESGLRVCEALSFTINAGEAVAIVGPSGCGKSTTLALIMRLATPTEGTIRIDGVPLSAVTESSLRASMAPVSQTPILLAGTLRDNIALGRPDSGMSEIAAAAEASGLADTIARMPGGYDTWIGLGGATLSGGERQRVAVARALISEAPILVLDEVTAALDPATEDVVNRSIMAQIGRRTVITVTHRLSSVTGYDRILVLQAGRLVEHGTHRELLAQCGLYAELWRKQSGFTPDDTAFAATPERLRLIPFLSSLDTPTLAQLTQVLVAERFPEGSVVVHQGEVGDKFYVLVRGIMGTYSRAGGGEEIRSGTLRDGDFFGEIALVRDQPRMASVRALTDAWCLVLPRRSFLSLFNNNLAVRKIVLDAIERRTTEME